MKVAFLGLGVMGFPMAGHLAAAGHEVAVFNRTRAKAERWAAQHGGRVAATPADAARAAAMVFACVGNDDDVRQITLGADGALAAMAPGAVFVDHTTTSARLAREIDAAARERGRALPRRAGVGRPVGRREGHPDRHGGRRARDLRRRRADRRLLRAHLPPARTGRCRSAHQDGEPDLHRRPDRGTRRGAALRARVGTRPAGGDRRDRQGRGAVVADGQPPRDHDRRRVRARLRRRLGAQGPRRSP